MCSLFHFLVQLRVNFHKYVIYHHHIGLDSREFHMETFLNPRPKQNGLKQLSPIQKTTHENKHRI